MMTANSESYATESAVPMRQVRLRPASAPLYPTLQPGEWHSAATLAARLLTEAARMKGSDTRAVRERILPEEHFEFRGGRHEASLRYRARARTRWADHPSGRIR